MTNVLNVLMGLAIPALAIVGVWQGYRLADATRIHRIPPK